MKSKTRILSIFPTICVMVGIFYFSSQSAIESSGLSSNFTEKVLTILQHIFHIPMETSFFQMIETIIRKIGHFTEYGILAFSISYSFYVYGRRKWKLVIGSEIVAIIYAATDEFHQLFVPGRSGQITDVLIDGCGAFIGCILFYLLSNIITKNNKTKKNRRN